MGWLGRLRRRMADDRGVTAVEYGLIVALVALVAIPAIYFLQNALAGPDGAYQQTLASETGVADCTDNPNCEVDAYGNLPDAVIPVFRFTGYSVSSGTVGSPF
jgi:Flp pilus assembly pilin Flp